MIIAFYGRIGNMKKICLFIILLLVCLNIILAFGSAEKPETIKITLVHGWGGAAPDHVAMRKIYSDFQTLHPEIELVTKVYPDLEVVLEKETDELALGRLSDIVSTNGDGKLVMNAITLGLAENLMPYLDSDPIFSANISPAIRSSLISEDNKLYTIPDSLEVVGFWYNKRILEECNINQIPTTWEGLIEAIIKIEKGGLYSAFNTDLFQNKLLFSALLASASQESLDFFLKNNGKLTEEAVLYAIENLNRILSNIDSTLYTSFINRSRFYEGNVAFYFNGVWANTELDVIANSEDYAYAAYPSFNNKTASFVSAVPGYIVNSKGSETQRKARVELIKYMLSEEIQKRILVETRQVPSNPLISVDWIIQNQPHLGHAIKVCYEADYRLHPLSTLLKAPILSIVEEFCAEPQNKEFQAKVVAVLSQNNQ